LNRDEWELIVVDNLSDEPLDGHLDLSAFRHARIVREAKLGLTPARLRGIAEARGELLVFVDDDNVLALDYLDRATNIDQSYAFLGAWGGTCLGDFPFEPHMHLRPYLSYLALRTVTRIVWGNEYRFDIIPFGAGLCVRKRVADAYARSCITVPLREELDRKGLSLVSGGDSDIVFTAVDLGLGMGLFCDLKLTHIIPAERLKREYLERLLEGIAFSSQIVLYLHGITAGRQRSDRVGLLVAAYRRLRMNPDTRVLEDALIRGRQRGIAWVESKHVSDDLAAAHGPQGKSG